MIKLILKEKINVMGNKTGDLIEKNYGKWAKLINEKHLCGASHSVPTQL